MKRYREALGMSQMTLATAVGCSTTLIGNIETLKRFPSAENLGRIAEALRVHPSELLAEDSESIKRVESAYMVRERLEEKILKAIDEALADRPDDDEDRSSPRP
jgi:Predicted transcriptional regulator with C-terminal CBS domains